MSVSAERLADRKPRDLENLTQRRDAKHRSAVPIVSVLAIKLHAIHSPMFSASASA